MIRFDGYEENCTYDRLGRQARSTSVSLVSGPASVPLAETLYAFKMPGGIEQFQTGNANDPLNQYLSTQWRQQLLLRASPDRLAD